MPSNTPKGYPYPLGTDRVTDGDDAIHNLATAVDTLLGVAASGIAVLPAPSAAGVNSSLAITFPVGRFTQPPQVLTAAGQSTAAPITSGVSSVATTGGVTLYAARLSGGMNTISVHWHAVQLP